MRRSVIWVSIIVALVAGGLVAWNNGIRNYFFPKQFRVVEAGKVYASGQISGHIIRKTIQDYHIQRIISLTDDPGDVDEAAERQAAKEMGLEYFIFALNGDGTGDIHQYENTLVEVTRAMHDSAPILVHCYAGTQRTRGWIAFYRLLIQHRPPDEVKAELVNGSWSAEPNPLLIPFINDHMAEMAALLMRDGIIDKIPDPLPRLEP